MTTENKKAGGYAASLAAAAAVRALGAYLMAIGGTAAALVAAQAHHTTAMVAGGVFALFGWVLASRAKSQYQKAAIGARSERRVARALRQLRPVALANSLLLGAGGDADHVVVGPWLCVVETKTGRGRVRWQGGHLVAGTRTIPGNPLAQARAQSTQVTRLTHEYCDAIVCVPDMTNPPFVQDGVTVCSLADLRRVVTALRPRLDSNDAARVFSHLQATDLHQRQLTK